MANIEINITDNGTTTLATAGKYCDKNVDVVVNVAGGGGGGAIVPEDKLVIQGNCQYKFYKGVWDWFISEYADKITTNDITQASFMFSECKLERIPFDINFRYYESASLTSMFEGASNLEELPKIPKVQPTNLSSIFDNCYALKHIPEDYCDGWDFSYLTPLTSAYSGSQDSIFRGCRSMRSYPNGILKYGNPNISPTYSIYNQLFNSCYSLDEVVDLPFPHYNASWTSNAFSDCFKQCLRLKKLTFALQEDGSPYVMKWKNQTIDLTTVGNAPSSSSTIPGFTIDTRVDDDAAYEALKDTPDWWAYLMAYSRYNHDSAIETINTLPDCSATGTNIIKFKGGAGEKTDGGAINTLTEEEIAVATAKGWTVTLS